MRALIKTHPISGEKINIKVTTSIISVDAVAQAAVQNINQFNGFFGVLFAKKVEF